VNLGLTAAPDWQSAALPFPVDDVLAEAVTHRAAIQSGEMIKTIGRLKFLAQKLHFILENAFMPCDLWFCRHLRRPFSFHS
jgi:hypothetical protein